MPKVKRVSAKDVDFHVSPWQRKSSGAAASDGSEGENADRLAMEYGGAVHTVARDPALRASAEAAAAPEAKHRDSPGSNAGLSEAVSPAETGYTLPAVAGVDTGAAQQGGHLPDVLDRYRGDEAGGDSDVGAGEVHMQGAACIAWLPDGRCTGHVVDARRSRTLGLMGQQVLARQECARDEEWRLLHVVLIDLATRAQVTFLAEKRGGDAAKLTAPIGEHGSEAALAEEDALADCDASLRFTFLCDTILADAKAQEHLAAIHPALTGRPDVTLNMGTYTCSGAGLRPLLHITDQHLYDSDLDAG